jgi:hypothetical protein
MITITTLQPSLLYYHNQTVVTLTGLATGSGLLTGGLPTISSIEWSVDGSNWQSMPAPQFTDVYLKITGNNLFPNGDCGNIDAYQDDSNISDWVINRQPGTTATATLINTYPGVINGAEDFAAGTYDMYLSDLGGHVILILPGVLSAA